MRLLNVESHRLEQFNDGIQRKYAILSHTWGTNEPTYQDFCADPEAVLYTPKVQGLLDLAKHESSPIRYVWIDTICIDKTSSAELQEAINSMYKWYQNATICYAYLEDVDLEEERNEDEAADTQMTGTPVDQHTAFDRAVLSSRWFKRGWTLQELIAPHFIYFHNAKWQRIGIKLMVGPTDRQHAPYKLGTKNFVPLIHEATGIPVGVLEGRERMQSYSVGQRMSWASKRKTTREEDLAYCLMGLFEVNMPMLYGEGQAAFLRLQEEIMKRTDDHSLLAYNYRQKPTFMAKDYIYKVRPLTPEIYEGCAHVKRLWLSEDVLGLIRGNNSDPVFNNTMEHYAMTNKGLHIELDTLVIPTLPGMLVARLNCIVKDEAAHGRPENRVVVLPLYQLPTLPGSKVVVRTPRASLVDLPLWVFEERTTITRPLYIINDPYDTGIHRGSRPLLEFFSGTHSFVVAEIYPLAFDFSPFQGDSIIMGGWPMCFSYAVDDLPRRIYMRFRSELRNISFLVKLKLEYDARHRPSRAECSVAAMPPDKSLLELLVLDEYPARHGPIQTTATPFGYTEGRIENTQTLLYRSNVVVKVQVTLLEYYRIQLTVTADVSGAVDVDEDEYEQLVEA